MPKRNYQFEKRQKELDKKRKKEEKRQRQLERTARPAGESLDEDAVPGDATPEA